MKPNFALSLSFEGIRLLHRTGSGAATVWTLVGEVAIDAPDLASQLALLRKTGVALDPQGLRTKLLIPNDQIKYLSLDTTRAGDDDVRAALDGTTPYAVSDLTYDYVRGGGRTYIAAVARETLAEAEEFAAEHRFGPVCFAGVPAPFTYVGEAFFGQTSVAERLLGPGQRVDRDEVAVAYQPKVRQSDKGAAPLGPLPLTNPTVVLPPEPDGLMQADRIPDPVSDPVPDPVPEVNAAPAQAAGQDVAPPPADGSVDNGAPPANLQRANLQTANLPPPDPARLDFAPRVPTLFEAATATTLALPNLPGETLDDGPADHAVFEGSSAGEAPFVDEAPFIDMSSDPDPVLPGDLMADTAGPSHSANAADASGPGPMSPPGAKPIVPDLIVPNPLAPDPIAAEPVVARPPLVPEPVFASRGRTLRADAGDVPAPRQPLPPPPGSRTPRADPGAEPVFSRRTEPPIAGPATNPVPAASAFGATDPETPAFASRSGMALPRLIGAERQAADAPAPRPFNAKFPAAATAPAVTGQSGAARPADAVAATVIPFRPHSDPADQTAATAVSIQTVSVTPGTSARAAPTVTAPSVESGKPGSFASRHGGTTQPLLKTAAEPAAARPAASTLLSPAPPALIRQPAIPVAGRGKPRYLALILTLILLAFMAAVAAWATYLSPDGLAGLFGRTAPTEVAEAPAAPSPLTVSDLTATALVSPQDSPAAPPTIPSAGDAPLVAAVPGLVTPDGTADAVALLPPETAPEVAPETVQATTTTATDPAATELGHVVSPAEAERIYAATGVWLRAPRLPLIPTADPVGTLVRATADSGVSPVPQPVMPALAGAAPDQAMLTPIDPPAPGTVFARDARGFILATPEGTLTPEGILVYAGAPAVVPPNRPGSAEAIAVVGAEPVAVVQSPPRIIAATAPPLAPRPFAAAADSAVALPDPPALAETAAPLAGGVGLNSLGATVRPLIRPLIQPQIQPQIQPATLPPQTLPVTAVSEAPILAAYAGPAPQLRPGSITPATGPDAGVVVDPAAPLTNASTDTAVQDTVAAILAASPPAPITSDSPFAVASARIPEARPQNFADVVASAQPREPVAAPQNPSLAVIDPPPEAPPQAPAPQPEVQPAAQPAPQPELLPESAIADETIAPSGPIPGGVAANATLAQAMDLREVNLIGVFGRPNDRRALVRLANGRYVRVGVGDSLDGGQVAAIGDNALNYVKRGQTITIAIPNG